MDTFKVGRNKQNDIVFGNESISSFHLEVDFIDYDQYFIRDLNSTNGTFVNERRISKIQLVPSDRFRLGTFEVETQVFFEKVNHLVKKNKTDFRQEYIQLLNLFDQYQSRKNKILKPSLGSMLIRIIPGFVIILLLILFPNVIPANARYPLMTGIGLLAVIANFFGNSQIKKSEKLDLLKLEFEEKLVCPKCGYKMINQNITYWRGKSKCINEKCDAIYQ